MGGWCSRSPASHSEASPGKKPMAETQSQTPPELAPGKRRRGVQVCKAYALRNSGFLVVSAGSVVDFQGDAIVNAANEGCITGGGVDGAITSAGGPALAQARRALPIQEGTRGVRCPTGAAVITIGGDLKAQYCIHAVGPNYFSEESRGRSMQECDELLASAYRESMARGKEQALKSIGFSLISSGIFRGSQSLRKVLEAGVAGILDGVYPELEEVHMIAFTRNEQQELQEVCADLLANSSSPTSPTSVSGESQGETGPVSKEPKQAVPMQVAPNSEEPIRDDGQNADARIGPKQVVPMQVEEEVFTNEPPPTAVAVSAACRGNDEEA